MVLAEQPGLRLEEVLKSVDLQSQAAAAVSAKPSTDRFKISRLLKPGHATDSGVYLNFLCFDWQSCMDADLLTD